MRSNPVATRRDHHGWVPLRQRVSRDILKAEVRAWAERIGVEVKELHIRAMKRKWASCSTSGRLTFSEDLLRQSAEVRRQAIVHELLHLKVPNHGKLFRALLKAYLESGGPPTPASARLRT